MFYQENIFILAVLAIVLIAILAIVILLEDIRKILTSKKDFGLSRHHKNPILSPIAHSDWENEAVFNPAVFLDNENTVHILYRAIGSGGLSQIGYAKSPDGLYIEKRYPYPIYQPEVNYAVNEKEVSMPQEYNPSIYTSGGGWAGCEDPRLVCIDQTVYMTYVSFEGWGNIRMALTSISLDDFKKAKWNWKKPILISPKGQTHKNWVLFPEKINGKFAIIHSITPKILIEYFDHPHIFREKPLESSRPQGPQPGPEGSWDNKIRGSGPPPVKIDEGWLLLYHAIENREPHKYKLGMMLLDLNDPSKVLYRASAPILSPDMHYENDGKPGVVYASGAFIKDGELFVYYGGGDKVVCLAKAPIKDLLKFIKSGGEKSFILEEA
jgi:predicted GH43/DUF377 family glycosyl hydrolase